MARFEEVIANRGVDSVKFGSEWMMVPNGGDNLVRLSDGDGYTVTDTKGRLTIGKVLAREAWGAIGTILRPDDRFFRIGSRTGGETTLEASKKGQPKVSMMVSVHPRRSFKVGFFFLQDRSGGSVTSRTMFQPAEARGWVNGLNDVFGPQANIWFENGKAELLPLADLSPVVGSKKDLGQLEGAHKSGGMAISVFLAGDKIESLDGTYPLGFYDVASKVIVVKDQVVKAWGDAPNPMLATIAHEIGHFFNYRHGAGQGHDFWSSCGYRSDILNTLSGNDIKIPHQRVLDWNQW